MTRSRGEGFDEAYLRELVETGDTEQLSSLIARAANEVPGTRPFWTERRNQLESIVWNIDCPHIFFTFSAADMQWPDLHQHMPPSGSIQAQTGPETYRARNEDLSNNPHIATAWLKKRFDIFFEVIKKKFNITDHWYRFEWQQRGSGHIHGFLWLADAPKPYVATAMHWPSTGECTGRQQLLRSTDEPVIILLLFPSISRRILSSLLMTV